MTTDERTALLATMAATIAAGLVQRAQHGALVHEAVTDWANSVDPAIVRESVTVARAILADIERT